MAKKYSYHSPNGSVKFDGGDGGCCNASCLKFSLYLFNALLFLTGLVLIGVGLWTLLEKHESLELLSSGWYELIGYGLVVLGSLVILASFLGCCGLGKTSQSLVCSYAAFLVVLLLLELGLGLFAYYYRREVNLELDDNLQQKFNVQYGSDAFNETTVLVDNLQESLSCCGVHSFEDWEVSAWHELPSRRNNKVPDSCCITPSRFCGVRDHPSNIRYTGCIDRISKIAGDHLLIVGSVLLGICLIQLVGLIMALILRCKLRDDTYYA